ncbi:MAG: glutamine--tRNA ligase, partial [Armatimonadetes bacterium]|nr:glutamine--tRNA ligase [Akkermansiaceae bacterium]
HAPRRMAVLDPLKLIIENFTDEPAEALEVVNHPQDESFGNRPVKFSSEIFIEQEDFMEDPPKKFFRLGPDRYVRLRGGPIIQCTGFEKDAEGKVILLRARLLPNSTGKDSPEGIACKAVIHWVDGRSAATATVRLYERLFTVEDPDAAEGGFLSVLNPESVQTIEAKIESSLLHEAPGFTCQFERMGYFIADSKDHIPGQTAVYNRTVALRDSWVKSR